MTLSVKSIQSTGENQKLRDTDTQCQDAEVTVWSRVVLDEDAAAYYSQPYSSIAPCTQFDRVNMSAAVATHHVAAITCHVLDNECHQATSDVGICPDFEPNVKMAKHTSPYNWRDEITMQTAVALDRSTTGMSDIRDIH